MGTISYGQKRASKINDAGTAVEWGSWGSRSGWDIVWTQIYQDSSGQNRLATADSVCYKINISWGTSGNISELTVGIPLGQQGRTQQPGYQRAIVRASIYDYDPTTYSPPSGQTDRAPTDYLYQKSDYFDIYPVPTVSTCAYTWQGPFLPSKPTTLYLLIDVIYDAFAPANEGVNCYVVHSFNGTQYGYVTASFREPVKYTVTYNGNDSKGYVTNVPSKQTLEYGSAISSTNPTNIYRVTLDANGGTASATNVDSTRAFNSWNTKSDGTGTKIASGGAYNLASDSTLYAQWNNPTTVNLPVATRAGYDFLGWGTTKEATTLYNGTYTPTMPITLFANWKRKGIVHIYSGTDSKWHSYIAWVYAGDAGGPNKNGWHQAIPMVYSGSKFHTCG